MSEQTERIFVKKWTDDPTIKDNKSAYTTKGVHAAIARVIGISEGETLLVDGHTVDERRPEGMLILNPKYNPGLNISFNGNTVKIGATEINLAGTVKVSENVESGVVKIQVGDNMNCSSWNNVDGSTEPDGKASDGYVNSLSKQSLISNYRCPNYTGSGIDYGEWVDGNTNVATCKNASISFTSKECVHLNDGDNVWTISVYRVGLNTETLILEAKRTDTIDIIYTNPDDPNYKLTGGQILTGITGSSQVVANGLDYTPGDNMLSSGVTTTYTGLALEDNYPYAVGARYKRTFNFDLNAILPSGGCLKIVIEGCGGKFTQTNFFYLTGYNVVAGVSTLVANNYSNYKYVSGVKYLTSGTKFTFDINSITNLNNQLGTNSNKLTFSGASGVVAPGAVASTVYGSSNLLDDNYTTNYDSVCGYTNTSISIADNINLEAASLKITGVNAKNSATSTATLSNVLLNTISPNTSYVTNDTTESFRDESKRFNSVTFDPWSEADKAKPLTDSYELQVVPGVGLIFPEKNYSTLEPMKTDVANSSRTADSVLYNNCGVDSAGYRYFVRKLIPTGDIVTGKIILDHNSHVKTALGNGNIKIEIAKEGINKWYDVMKTAVQSPSNGIGVNSSVGTNSSWYSFQFTDGQAPGWFWVRISYKIGTRNTANSNDCAITKLAYGKV